MSDEATRRAAEAMRALTDPDADEVVTWDQCAELALAASGLREERDAYRGALEDMVKYFAWSVSTVDQDHVLEQARSILSSPVSEDR